jgi:glycerol-1-phosphate dehydrogenase [NAD(P)+]
MFKLGEFEPGEKLRFVDDIASEVISICGTERYRCVTVISDSNTFPIAGNQLYRKLRADKIPMQSIILSGSRLITDEQAVMSVLIDLNPNTDVIVAVGSGTITDIVRFISHRKGIAFISVPTAPSSDGYSSNGAPVMFRGYKRSFRCHAPIRIVTSLSLLAEAPDAMIVAGFGNVVGKITALADWKLAHVILDRPYDEHIATNLRERCESLLERTDSLVGHHHDGIRDLFETLNTAGEAVERYGSSDPASGSEHHISHIIEMYKYARDLPVTLHGIKVASGTLIAADWYRKLREFDPAVLASMAVDVPDWENDAVELRRLLGEAGAKIFESNDYLQDLTQPRVSQIKKRLLDRWDEIQKIARTVPDPHQIAALLQRIGAPVRAMDIGLSVSEIRTAARLSHYVRSRFTIKTLFFSLGMDSSILETNPVIKDRTDDVV